MFTGMWRNIDTLRRVQTLNEDNVAKESHQHKILASFTKFEDLYRVIQNFLHLILRFSFKTHAETVAKSMGSYIDYHSNKSRGLDIATVGCEIRIHWNGPLLHKGSALIESALDRHFVGRSNWHFVIKENKHASVVVSKMKKKRPRVSWF